MRRLRGWDRSARSSACHQVPSTWRRSTPAPRPARPGGKDAARDSRHETGDELADLQERLFAEATVDGSPRRVLLVLQGMDCSGKDGAIKRGLGGMNPKWMRHHGLRHADGGGARAPLPVAHPQGAAAAGDVGVFDRSHYEDVVAVRARELVARGGLAAALRRDQRVRARARRGRLHDHQGLPAHLAASTSSTASCAAWTASTSAGSSTRATSRTASAGTTSRPPTRRRSSAATRRRPVVRRAGRPQVVPDVGGRPSCCWRRCASSTRSSRSGRSSTSPRSSGSA